MNISKASNYVGIAVLTAIIMILPAISVVAFYENWHGFIKTCLVVVLIIEFLFVSGMLLEISEKSSNDYT